MQQTLVIVNSGAATFGDAEQLVLPYLRHFGIPHDTLDVLHAPLPADLGARSLLVVAQRDLDARGRRLGTGGRRALREAVEQGAGLVSFDPAILGDEGGGAGVAADAVTVSETGHPITALRAAGESLLLAGVLQVPPLGLDGDAVLLRAGAAPLLAARSLGRGRAVRWATPRWAQTKVLGPLAGLDDLLLRGLVWAARKPFALRGMAPLVTMRVDDVAGSGGRWGRSPLYWAREAARHGFRPWLGLFLYNLADDAVAEVRELVGQGDATAFPHAFGRPPRDGVQEWHYAEDGLPLRASEYDEFIYFDHQSGRAWDDAEAARGLAAVDAWYERHGPLPISRYAVAHWYEMGANTVQHMTDRWGVDLIGKIQDADAPLRDETPWLRLGPFRRYEQPGTALFEPALRGDRPVYYADFVSLGGRQLFDCVTEIRDDAGYEWAPDTDVAATVGRGVRQLRRALDSMALPVLFTHETDFIYRIPPAAWSEALAGIATGISGYRPIPATLDEGVRYVRARQTAPLAHAAADGSGRLAATLRGRADLTTHLRVFTEEDAALEGALVEVPPFDGEITVRV